MRKNMLLLPVLALATCRAEESERWKLKIEPCFNQQLSENVRCGTLEVMENRRARTGARVNLSFMILPAKGPNPSPDPIFCFSGGPGEGTASRVEFWAATLEKIRKQRDIVLLDQRGTGASNPLASLFFGMTFPQSPLLDRNAQLRSRVARW